LLNFEGGVGVYRVTGRATDRIERIDEWYARRKHGCQSSRPTRDRRLFHQLAKDGYSQQQPIHQSLNPLIALPGLEEKIHSAAQYPEDEPPVGHEKLAHGNHGQCGPGQLGTKGGEDFLESRHHEHHDDCHHDERDDQHRRRIHQRRLDLALDGFGFFQIGRQAVENVLQNTGGFGSLDEIAVQRVEVVGVLAKSRAQGSPCLDIGADLVQQPCNAGVGVAAADDIEGLQQWHTGFHHGGQLSGKESDVFRADALGRRQAALFDFLYQDALTAQLRLHLGLASCAYLALDGFAVAIFALPLVEVLFDGWGCRSHVSSRRMPRKVAVPNGSRISGWSPSVPPPMM
jgi:hypothetical protein